MTERFGSSRQPGVAVVSGGASGIGLATVRRLLEAGWRVGFFSQHEEKVAAARKQLLAEFGAHAPLFAKAADLRDPDAIAHFFSDLRRHCGPVTALVANAGYSPKGVDGRIGLAEIPLREWEGVLRVNLTGAFLCCQAVLPDMIEARLGRIVLVGSLAGRTVPKIAGASYVASKSALAGLARSIVSEYSGFGITANTVCPGRIITDMAGAPDSPANKAALERIPIGRLGTPHDVVRVIEFLLQAEADFVNGAILDVNGGEFTPT